MGHKNVILEGRKYRGTPDYRLNALEIAKKKLYLDNVKAEEIFLREERIKQGLPVQEIK